MFDENKSQNYKTRRQDNKRQRGGRIWRIHLAVDVREEKNRQNMILQWGTPRGGRRLGSYGGNGAQEAEAGLSSILFGRKYGHIW